MSSYTENLNLFKYDIPGDNNLPFNIEDALNENWDRIDTAVTNYSNINLNNLTEAGEKHFLNKQQITNCILEDPQNIKLELNNGTLTLKAGSIVCVPNGFEADGTTPKFDEVTIESDLSIWNGDNITMMVYYVGGAAPFITLGNVTVTTSGTTPPNTGYFYNTSTNKVNFYLDGVLQWTGGSLPFALCTSNSTQITSIDQIFRSISYMGSTIFARKGLKVLIPNGRNNDGSLKNIEYILSKSVRYIVDPSREDELYIVIGTEDLIGIWNTWGVSDYAKPPAIDLEWCYYDDKLNIRQETMRGGAYYQSFWSPVAKITTNAGSLNNLINLPNTNMLKYSDKSQISGWSMPTVRYKDLILGSTGTAYIAPASGWVSIAGTSQGAAELSLHCNGTHFILNYTSQNRSMGGSLPVKKGAVFSVDYYQVLVSYFRFIYADGEV